MSESEQTPRPSHLAPDGSARMVDVGSKASTLRSAKASARVVFPSGLLPGLLEGRGPKGAITEVARVAGILAAKRTAELIPMCHPLRLDHVQIDFEARGDRLEITCRTSCQGPTGVEMEAMVGASLAALTVYDMCKGASHGIRVEDLGLDEKSGGRSGSWSRDPHPVD